MSSSADSSASPDNSPEVICATKEEKDYAISSREAFWKRNAATAPAALAAVQRAALDNGNKTGAIQYFERVVAVDPISPEAVQSQALVDQLKK